MAAPLSFIIKIDSSSSSQLQRRRNFNWEFVYIADNSQLIELWDGVGGVQHFVFINLVLLVFMVV